MRHLWIGLCLLTACGPRLEAANARHVMIEITASELVDTCKIPCKRALRPGETLLRCDLSEAGWHLDPRFEGETSPRKPPEVFDMAERLGPLAPGYALCSVKGAAR